MSGDTHRALPSADASGLGLQQPEQPTSRGRAPDGGDSHAAQQEGGGDQPRSLVAPPLAVARVAGRTNPYSRGRATTLSQRGIVHRWRWADDESEQSMFVLGAASSYTFSGKRLEAILRPGLELEQQALLRMAQGEEHAPISQHTSAGGVSALEPFVSTLEQHLPWPDDAEDWFVNLQVEGTSAVLAAVDILMQQAAEDDGIATAGLGSAPRRKIAVGSSSYHGPPATAFGAAAPLGKSYGTKAEQLTYPIPMRNTMRPAETDTEFYERTLCAYTAFLEAHAHEIAVMLFEPQWGSAACGAVWPRELLQQYIKLAQDRGIRVACDEIMCGLGRHGAGSFFLSKAWDLNPDAVTFGKAIGGGLFPLSGVVVRRGAKAFGAVAGRKVMQSHTYAGASARALMAAEATLNMLPSVFKNITERGVQCRAAFTKDLEAASAGMMSGNGQGLLWGAEWTVDILSSADEVARANAVLLEACRQEGVWPYFVPKGFIITPVLDVGAAELAEALRRLLQAISVTAVTISLSRCSSGGTRANSIPGGTAAAGVCSAVATGKAMVKVASVCTNCLLLPSSYEQRPSSSSS
eukprot:COSAG06_NODE_4378_length_4316_cov_1.604221_1_plen_578_part_10